MSDTFFTAAPDWTWFIVPYFFVGGIAGGAYFLAALLDWFGGAEDRSVVRTGYYVAAIGGLVSGALLTLDLGRPERFWHMLFQSNNLPGLSLKTWSPISFGSWILLLFSLFAILSALGARAEEGKSLSLRALHGTGLAKFVALVGGLLGLGFGGYTGVLLAVTNRPIWADSPWLGALFLASGVSTGAATLVLLGLRRGAAQRSLQWLSAVDNRALLVELVILALFLASLGQVFRVWLSGWGVVLLVGVVGAGILLPLGLHLRPGSFGRLAAQPMVNAARLVLVGGFLLRFVTLLASEGIEHHRVATGVLP
ncbi:MAG TPA: NrfD/PsrC family molybdoenzyme membrane anchor subunit [Gemmatimonadales bacterium]|nr:NrfD/PsrC family molybdoenzyme membrane anchor subunit [Gemmatimonadales bacterium]